MEEMKYYTPTIEEFHVGFEYEYKSEDGSYSTFADSKGEWKKKIFNNEAEYDYEELTEFQSIESALQDEYKRYGDVRVKHLDKEDIESLGWNFAANQMSKWDAFRLNDKVLEYLEEDNQVHIYKISPYVCLFQGTIKNKSRLRLIMQMVGII